VSELLQRSEDVQASFADARRRRGSLLQKHGYSLAEVAEALGDSKVVTAEHYVYALGDYREAARDEALARVA
jgi:hypothetical protein